MRQLMACTEIEDVEVPEVTLAAVVAELDALARLHRETGHMPVGPKGFADYRSTARDVLKATAGTGPGLRALLPDGLPRVCEASGRSEPSALPPWTEMLAAAQVTYAALSAPSSLVAAFDDALEAAVRSDERSLFAIVLHRLRELRAVAEIQGRDWNSLRSVIENHLTVRETDGDGRRIGGVFARGESLDVVLDALRAEIATEPDERTYAVWVAVLAGPALDDHQLKPTLSGAIASSAIPFTGDSAAWASLVRDEMSALFREAGRDVPGDVASFGAPMEAEGQELLSGEQLWADLADPPSFVVRVEVRAKHSGEAVAIAHLALGATFGRSEPRLVRDIRPDSVTWNERGGWHVPQFSARGRSRGEMLAARSAGNAVASWADDLGAPLDAERIEHLRARALVADRTAPLDVRLLRAFLRFEVLTPGVSRVQDAGQRLWLRSVWAEFVGTLRRLLFDVALQPSALGPLRDGADWTATFQRIEDLKRTLDAPDGPGWGTDLVDLIEVVMTDVDAHALARYLMLGIRNELRDPGRMSDARDSRVAAWARARRHRNLLTHGWPLPDVVLEPTVAFLAGHLELATYAEADDSDEASWRWLGSLSVEPSEDWTLRTPAELLDAAAIAARR